MTYSEFKESDLHKCMSIAGEAAVSIAKFIFKVTSLLFRGARWLVTKAYNYVMR